MKIYEEDKPRQVGGKEELLTDHQLIVAAGGLVTNDEHEVLMIFRRGKWDLPKGKFEENETVEECAEREVKEETGLQQLQLKRALLVTYHTYSDKKTRYLKETHWFLFNAPGKQPVVPQTEEDITKIEWVKAKELSRYLSNSYGLIKEVLEAGGII